MPRPSDYLSQGRDFLGLFLIFLIFSRFFTFPGQGTLQMVGNLLSGAGFSEREGFSHLRPSKGQIGAHQLQFPSVSQRIQLSPVFVRVSLYSLPELVDFNLCGKAI